MMAPPTMAVDRSPEACVVYSLSPLTDNEKIVANIIELHNPTAIIVHAAIGPAELMETAMSTTAMIAQKLKTKGGFTLCKMYDPIKRPTSILPQ